MHFCAYARSTPAHARADSLHGQAPEEHGEFMRNYDVRLHDTVREAVRCLTREERPDEPRLGASRSRLVAHLARLDELHAALFRAPKKRKDESFRVRMLGQTLRRQHMIPISRPGKKLLASAPGAERAFKVPHARAGTEQLLAAAARMVKLLKPRAHARLFVEEAGFPQGFVIELQEAAARLRAYAPEPAGVLRRRRADTAAYTRELRAAREEMRIVEAIAIAREETDPQFLSSWRLFTKLKKRLGRPKGRRGPDRRPGPDV
jgi:hypothetical protein